MKNNLRLILYVMAFGIAFILWNKWQIANQPTPTAPQTTTNQSMTPAPSASGEGAPIPSAAAGSASVEAAAGEVPAQTAASADVVQVSTDVLHLTISLQGATIIRAELLDYPATKNSEQPLALMRTDNPGRFIMQSGLASNDSAAAPTHNAIFSATQSSYRLESGQDTLQVPFTWVNEQGVQVTKTFTFTRGKYEIGLTQTVANGSATPWQGYPYQQLDFGSAAPRGGIGQVYTFTGGVMSTSDNRYRKIDLDDIRKSNTEVHSKDGWVAMIQHYFLGALIPPEGSNSNFYTRYYNGNHIIGISGQNYSVAPDAEVAMNSRMYIGPKIQSRLQSVAPALDKTVDYGFLFMIAQPMFYVLNFIHGIIGNWGWAIIVMTLLIKLMFFMPSAWAYKSMAKMRRLQPHMARLKERYGDDRQAMSQAMMKLYRDEKVNPASGCLPMLLQIPFFIAFYWVLVESVELRQAPWMWWIQDLSAKDPLFILPVINAALMFLQQKLNPTPPDPMQAKIMMMLPLVFGFMFMWFPSGLVLYWTVSNAFSIVQQYIMNKRYGEPSSKAA